MNKALTILGTFALGAVAGVLAYKNKDAIEKKGKKLVESMKDMEDKLMKEVKTIKETISEKIAKDKTASDAGLATGDKV